MAENSSSEAQGCKTRSSKTTKTSKTLSFFLRHGGKEKGIELDSGGWADLSNLLSLQQFKNVI